MADASDDPDEARRLVDEYLTGPTRTLAETADQEGIPLEELMAEMVYRFQDAEIEDLTRQNEELLQLVEDLRRAFAYEARVVEAHVLDLKALGANRRRHIGGSVVRMRRLARGRWPQEYNERFTSFRREKDLLEPDG